MGDGHEYTRVPTRNQGFPRLMEPSRDKLLIDTTLAELDRMALPDLESQGNAVGVSGETVRKWRAGISKRLNRKSRPHVLRFLQGRGKDTDKLVISRGVPDVKPNGAGGRSDLVRYVDAILAAEEPAEIRAWQIAELGALYRSYALAKEADAADRRARAVMLEARARREALRQVGGGTAAARVRQQARQRPSEGGEHELGEAAG